MLQEPIISPAPYTARVYMGSRPTKAPRFLKVRTAYLAWVHILDQDQLRRHVFDETDAPQAKALLGPALRSE